MYDNKINNQTFCFVLSCRAVRSIYKEEILRCTQDDIGFADSYELDEAKHGKI